MASSWMSMLCWWPIKQRVLWYWAHPSCKQALIDAVHEHSIDITAEFCPKFTQRHLPHLNTEHLHLDIHNNATMQPLALMESTHMQEKGLEENFGLADVLGCAVQAAQNTCLESFISCMVKSCSMDRHSASAMSRSAFALSRTAESIEGSIHLAIYSHRELPTAPALAAGLSPSASSPSMTSSCFSSIKGALSSCSSASSKISSSCIACNCFLGRPLGMTKQDEGRKRCQIIVLCLTLLRKALLVVLVGRYSSGA